MVECFHVREIPQILKVITDVNRWIYEHPDLFVKGDYVSKQALDQYIRAHYKDNRARRQMLYSLSKASTVEIESPLETTVNGQSMVNPYKTKFTTEFDRLPYAKGLNRELLSSALRSKDKGFPIEKAKKIVPIFNYVAGRESFTIEDIVTNPDIHLGGGDKARFVSSFVREASWPPRDYLIKSSEGTYRLNDIYRA